jgi:transcriptional regulator with XRE-family HTH domain
MKDIINNLKENYGFSYEYLAGYTGKTRQYISKIFKNNSVVYRSAQAYLLNIWIDYKIIELERQIKHLQYGKMLISESFCDINTKQKEETA